MGGSALLGFLGAGQQASAAQSAAQQQSDAARYAADLQQKQFDLINQQQSPYRSAGYSALNKIGSLGSGTYQMYDANGNPTGTGTGNDYLTHQVTAADLTEMPGYTFGLEQGVGAGQQTANVGGGGSNITRGAQKFATDYATNVGMPQYNAQRQQIYNTLAGIAGIGQTGQSQVNQAGMNTASNIGSAASAAAGYGAAGKVGAANAYSGALSNMGNAGMMYGLMNKPSGGGMTNEQLATNPYFTPA
jgi:hypothetical protein